MKKVSELEDDELDLWVGKAGGNDYCPREHITSRAHPEYCFTHGKAICDRYSTDWAVGGPLVEWLKMDFNYMGGGEYEAHIHPARVSRGKTMLIAAMRCYVASKFGDEVDDS